MKSFNSLAYQGFPVINEKNELVGVVTISDVQRAIAKGSIDHLLVSDIATSDIFVVYGDETLTDVLTRLGDREYGRIPVVEPTNRRRLVGVLRRHDVIRGYTLANESANDDF